MIFNSNQKKTTKSTKGNMMKKVLLTTLFTLLCSLSAYDNFDESQYAEEIVGSQYLKGAKFVGEKIWQDQPINGKKEHFTYQQAKTYCEDLSLLGINQWTLPTVNDFKILDTEFKAFEYNAQSRSGYGYKKLYAYITSDLKNGKFRPVIVDPPYPEEYSKAMPKTYKSSVRCVLNPNTYNEIKMKESSKAATKENFEGYLNAFVASGDKSYVKKAYTLAKTPQEKAKLEYALIQNFSLDEIFEFTGSLVGNQGAGTSNSEFSKFIVRTIQSTGKAVMNLRVSKKSNSRVPLKYGTYKVKMNIKLKLSYVSSGFGMSLGESETLSKDIWVELGPKNIYIDYQKVDFGEIIQDLRGEMLFKLSKKLKGIKTIITFQRHRVIMRVLSFILLITTALLSSDYNFDEMFSDKEVAKSSNTIKVDQFVDTAKDEQKRISKAEREREERLLREARKNSNQASSHCFGIKNKDLQHSCIAMSSNNQSVCYAIKDKDMQDNCVAITTRNSSICYGIRNKDLQESCVAITTHNESICYGVKSKIIKDSCVAVTSNNESMCYGIRNQDMQYDCIANFQ